MFPKDIWWHGKCSKYRSDSKAVHKLHIQWDSNYGIKEHRQKKIEIINIKMSTVVILSGKIRNFLGYSVLFKPSLTSWTALTSERKK